MDIAQVLEHYQPLTGWRANFVLSLKGAFTDPSGSSRGVSSAEDRALLIHLRRLSDVVLVSAKSAKAEALNSTKLTTLAIVSSGGSLAGIPALTNSKNPVIVIAPKVVLNPLENTGSASIVTIDNETEGRISPSELKGSIEKLGFKRPLVEFGPDWLQQLVRAKQIDELCLSIVKEPEEKFTNSSPEDALRQLKLHGELSLVATYEISNTLFTRWQ